jgi:hypothetical protein
MSVPCCESSAKYGFGASKVPKTNATVVTIADPEPFIQSDPLIDTAGAENGRF